jgi:hypothetical protein
VTPIQKYQRDWYLKNRESELEKARQRRLTDPEEFRKQKRETQRAWREKNRERDRDTRRAWQAANRDKGRASYLRYQYGIEPEDYDAMLSKQNGACAICAVELVKGSKTHIDHCHTTGKVRGLLCTKCNMGIGHFNDDPAVLRAAAGYVEAHK